MGISVKTEGGAIITVTPQAPRPITVQRPGVQGLQGIQGDAATIEVVSTTTLPPGSDATVENVGAPNDAKLAFGVPQGLRGPDGRVHSIIPGANIKVDDTDPGNPVVSTEADMATSVYDPQNIATDAFDRANHTGEMPLAALEQGTGGTGIVVGRYSSSGPIGALLLAATASNNSVPYRTGGGVLQVGTPTAGSHATTKAYVDAALAGKFDDPTGTTSQYIRGDGSLATFPSIPAGTVTSVGLSAPTGLSVSGSPVTGAGTLTFAYASGYTGFTTALQTKLNGIEAGAQVNLPVGTGAGTVAAGDDSRITGAVQTSRNITTQHSLQGGGNLSANRTLSLVGDTASPGNNKVYGTDASGTRGWKDDPAGGGIGVGQTWQNVAGSRAINTAYQNTTGKPIQLSVSAAISTDLDFQVSADGSTWVSAQRLDNFGVNHIALVIPNGWYYRLNAASGLTITYWLELR